MNIYTIYKITNTINNKIYIGFTNDLSRRITEHKRNHVKHNSKLYYAMRKYGFELFEFAVVFQSLDSAYCKDEMEQYFIIEYNSFNDGYNMTLGGDGSIGRTLSDDQRAHLRKINKNRPSLNKAKTYIEMYGERGAANKKLKMSEKMKQKPPKSADEKNRMIASLKRYYMTHESPLKGKTHTAETRQLISKLATERNAKNIGKTYDEIYGGERAAEIKKKKSEKLMGENNPRFGKPGTFLGKHHSEQVKLKISLANSGRTRQPMPILVCPHCNKASDAPNAKRWHFDNCKFKK